MPNERSLKGSTAMTGPYSRYGANDESHKRIMEE